MEISRVLRNSIKGILNWKFYGSNQVVYSKIEKFAFQFIYFLHDKTAAAPILSMELCQDNLFYVKTL